MNNSLCINVIILAAGSGNRVGSVSKWKLKYDGKLLLEFVYNKFSAFKFNNICYVVNNNFFNDCDFINSDIALNNNIKYIVNDFPELGMIYSIYLGINNNIGDYYIILPIDCPFIKTRTISSLIDAIYFYRENGYNDFIIKPTFKNHSGHPIIISKNIANKIPKSYDGGVKKFFDNDIKEDNIFILDVNDNGILVNINTMKDVNKYKLKF